MDREQAYERRVWRLAHLLASPEDAGRLVRLVVWRRRGELGRLDPAHLDRLVVLTAREMARGRPVASSGGAEREELPGTAGRALRALRELARQPMEAWILSRVDDMELMEVSKATDCSKTATSRHLEAAEAALAAALGEDLEPSTAALRAWVDSLEPEPALARLRQEERVRRRVRLALVTVGLVAVGLVVAWAVM